MNLWGNWEYLMWGVSAQTSCEDHLLQNTEQKVAYRKNLKAWREMISVFVQILPWQAVKKLGPLNAFSVSLIYLITEYLSCTKHYARAEDKGVTKRDIVSAWIQTSEQTVYYTLCTETAQIGNTVEWYLIQTRVDREGFLEEVISKLTLEGWIGKRERKKRKKKNE